jgi:hypothetical protein
MLGTGINHCSCLERACANSADFLDLLDDFADVEQAPPVPVDFSDSRLEGSVRNGLVLKRFHTAGRRHSVGGRIWSAFINFDASVGGEPFASRRKKLWTLCYVCRPVFDLVDRCQLIATGLTLERISVRVTLLAFGRARLRAVWPNLIAWILRNIRLRTGIGSDSAPPGW